MSADLPLFNVSPIVDRLKTGAPMLRDVGRAADLSAALVKRTIAGPMAFVVLTRADPYDVAEGSGPLRTIFTLHIAVVVGVTHAGPIGAAGLPDLDPPNDRIRGLLFGWKPPGALRKLHSVGEGLEDFDPATGILLYRHDFTTTARIQELTVYGS